MVLSALSRPSAPPTRRRTIARLLLVALVGGSRLATAQPMAARPTAIPTPTPRVGRAATITTPPVIDGRLDEAAWREAPLLTDFVQREPYEGTPVTERTEVRLLTDGTALYVGAWLYDREPQLIVPSETIRDVTLTNSDYFAFILDTYLDRQNGFLFGTTPSGIEHDAQVIREGEGGGVFQAGQNRAQAGSMGGINLNWDASWTVRTSRDSLGWYAEFRIPFFTLRYGGGETQDWGLNIMRGIRRRNEEALWSQVSRQFSITRLSQAGTLTGLAVPAQRIGTVTPYSLGNSSRTYATQSAFATTGAWGIDAKYGVTPSLTLDLTYNTDFAQVEVDEQRTNLTRFPIFFPEKRPFFLENAGVFAAGTPQAVDLFFTRRIGIDGATGQPQPILGGARLTGRVGGLTVGALQMVTDDAPGVTGNAYTVARVLKELSARSRVGVIAVQRTATGDARDFNVGEAFNPEVGFMSRPAGYRFDELMLMRLVRSQKWKQVRQWNPHLSLRRWVGTDGFLQSSWMHIDLTEVEFNSGGRFGPDVNIYTEGLQRPFTIAPGIVLPPGQYRFTVPGIDWGSDPSAPLSFLARLEAGEFYTGTRSGANVSVTARAGAVFSSSLVVDYQDVNLEQGDFIRQLIGVKLAYFFTPRVFLQTRRR